MFMYVRVLSYTELNILQLYIVLYTKLVILVTVGTFLSYMITVTRYSKVSINKMTPNDEQEVHVQINSCHLMI